MEAQFSTIKILLVEDNEVDQFAFKRHADKNNLPYDITVSPSVEETFLLLRTQSFDVVILDYMLKDGPSSELVPHLIKKMQVIFVTGQENLELAINAMKMGVYEYIVKDFDKTYLGDLPQIIDSAFRHKLASDRLKKTERKINKLSHAMSNMGQAILITGKNGRIDWVNHSFSQLVGYDNSELVGTQGEAFIEEGKLPGALSNDPIHDRVNTYGENVKTELELQNRKNEKFSCLLDISPIYDDNHSIELVVYSFTPVEGFKEQLNDLQDARDSIEMKTFIKERFINNISLESRRPLNSLMGMLQLLNATGLNEEQKIYSKALNQSARELLTLMQSIYDFTELNSGNLSLREKSFSMHELIQRVESNFRMQLNEEKVKFEVKVSPELPNRYFGDALRIEQCLVNLLSNAKKFTNQGFIKVKVSTTPTGLIEFLVEDSGEGISESTLGKIFESFADKGVENLTAAEGLGIGLKIVGKLVELMSGELKIKSEKKGGTKIFISLPLQNEKGNTLSTTNQNIDNNTDLTGLKVLLVEDNKMNQLLAQKFLMKLGANVSVADHGKDAIFLLKSDEFDMILMDLQMPVMDGFEATRIIRENMPENIKDIPIIAMTAHTIKGVEEKCMELGLTDFISKPILLENLREKMTQVMSKA